MNLYKHIAVLLTALLIACSSMSYGQVVVGSDGPGDPVKIDYSAPKKYEIGGITSSGTAPLEQRLLSFHVGDVIEIPGDEITKSVKSLWKTGLYDDVEISVTRINGNVAFLDVRLEDRARLISFGFKGTTKSEENDLREKLKISQGNIINDNMKTTCVNTIRKYFVDKGFYSCKVNVQELDDEKIKNAKNLLFDIQKSKRVRIGKININGNHGVTDAVLLRSMKETKEKFIFMPFHKMDTAIAYCLKHPGYYESKDIKEHMDDYFADRVKLRIFKKSKFNWSISQEIKWYRLNIIFII